MVTLMEYLSRFTHGSSSSKLWFPWMIITKSYEDWSRSELQIIGILQLCIPKDVLKRFHVNSLTFNVEILLIYRFFHVNNHLSLIRRRLEDVYSDFYSWKETSAVQAHILFTYSSMEFIKGALAAQEQKGSHNCIDDNDMLDIIYAATISYLRSNNHQNH